MNKIDDYIQALSQITSDDLLSLSDEEKLIIINHWKSGIALLEYGTLGT